MAEQYSYADFMLLERNEQKIKEAGKLKHQGKTYIVQDGDVIQFKCGKK
jgi:ribosome-binding ATPase YchF (GTP1/OBG family)